MDINRNSALLLIDIQKGFEDILYWGGNRNNPDAELKASILLDHWRKSGMPVFIIKHCSVNPGSPLAKGKRGNDLIDKIEPLDIEPVIEKNVNSAFIGTELLEMLRRSQVQQVIIAGFTTNHCISTTARMAGNLGFKTYVVSDACVAFDTMGHDGKLYSAELIHDTSLASLNNEFAEIMTTAQIIRHFSVL
ncbi:MAG: cysteine hydrolase family protein [Deltaproteobacteria bacterium]